MVEYSELYPCNNGLRSAVTLDGLWKFQFDSNENGEQQNWKNGLPSPIFMPVPSSFSDFFTTSDLRDYTGDFWYETEFYLQPGWENKKLWIRFGSLTHRARVYCNGVELVYHEGGFLPVLADITEVVHMDTANRLVIHLNNELNETSLPCGTTKILENGRKLSKPYFDFFNYSGIHRSVWLLALPDESIQDYSVNYSLQGEDALVHYSVITNGTHTVRVYLQDHYGNVVASGEGATGTLKVTNARLWQVRNAYLYTFVIEIHQNSIVLDRYHEKIGIRTVRIEGHHILINEKPVYLKGFGKHEDFELLGRGFQWGVVKRDFECMKWTEANCFRTSHYPYSEEWYQFADEEGFLILDEVPAVGMMRSTKNFVAAGSGHYTHFFEAPTVPALLSNHIQCTEEMIKRDKNHPSVFAWSLFNEPETTSQESYDYFSKIFAAARYLDPQHRPLTGAFEKNSKPELCMCYPLCDFICLNRYYGWYISGGPEIDEAEELFREEMNKWKDKDLNVPFVFTEFGTDTLPGEHKLPGIMWSEEYQNEYYKMNFRVFDDYDFIQGELVWNFADFQTTEGIMRVNGNKKGIFTRIRQPKSSAFILKKRWENR